MAKKKGPPPVEKVEGKKADPTDELDSQFETWDFWDKELQRSDRHEKDWREAGRKIVERYRAEKEKNAGGNSIESQYNVLFANTEVLQGVLYQQPPIPDVRPRSRKAKPLALAVANIIDQALSYLIDDYDFNSVMERAVQDRLLVGRAVLKVRYDADFSEVELPSKDGTPSEKYKKVTYERTFCENVDWELFRYSPAKKWAKVWWVGFGEYMTKADLQKKFPDFADKITLDWTQETPGEPDKREENPGDPASNNRTLIWTIWNKINKRVYILATGYKDNLLKKVDDPLHLLDFFPCAEPLYGIRTTNSLIPVCDFFQYEAQAAELDEITNRIQHLVKELKRRGIYDSSITALQQLANAPDNTFVPAEQFAAIAEKGVQNLLFELPIEGISKVLLNLYKQRDDVLNVIYSITGISDIIRGSSLASESATAQNIKAQYANTRVGPQQRAIARFAQANLKLKAEIISEHYSSDMLMQMTQEEYPTALQIINEKQQYKVAAMQAQQAGQQPPPPPPEKVSIEEIMAILRNDKLRSFNVNIQTDSTIVTKDAHTRQEISNFTTSIATLIQSLTPAVQANFIPAPAARELLLMATRKFEFGKDIDEVMEEAGDYQPPDPGQAEKEKQDGENQRAQAKMQSDQAIAKASNDKDVEIAKINASAAMQQLQQKHAHEQNVKSMEIFGQANVDESGTGQPITPFQLMQGMIQGMAALSQQFAQVALELQQLGVQNQLLFKAISAPVQVVRDGTGRIIGAQKTPVTVQ